MTVAARTDPCSVKEAAAVLGVAESQVRSLLRTGSLAGQRFGAVWLVDRDDLGRLVGEQRERGRPFSARIAWSVLAQLDGRQPPWPLVAEERSRVRRYGARVLDAIAPRLRARATPHRLSVGPALGERLVEHPRWMRGGTFDDAVATGYAVPATLYVASSDLESLIEDAAAVVDLERPNLIAMAVDDRYWPFGAVPAGTVVWDSVASLDALELGGGR